MWLGFVCFCCLLAFGFSLSLSPFPHFPSCPFSHVLMLLISSSLFEEAKGRGRGSDGQMMQPCGRWDGGDMRSPTPSLVEQGVV